MLALFRLPTRRAVISSHVDDFRRDGDGALVCLDLELKGGFVSGAEGEGEGAVVGVAELHGGMQGVVGWETGF